MAQKNQNQSFNVLNDTIDSYRIRQSVYYEPQGNEVVLVLTAYANNIPFVLKGPTGSGKSTLVEHCVYLLGVGFNEFEAHYKKKLSKNKDPISNKTVFEKIVDKCTAEQVQFRTFGFPLITINGHEDLDADTLKGRHYLMDEEVVWLNGPAYLAAKQGAFLYFDEPAEARPDTLVVLHELTDHRHQLTIERLGLTQKVAPSFGFGMSYNDRYQDPRKEFKPSTAQRFIHVPLAYPKEEDLEIKIVMTKTGLDQKTIRSLVSIARGTRTIAEKRELKEGASTREIIYAAQLINDGISPKEAALVTLCHPLTRQATTQNAIEDLIKNHFK